MSTLICTIHDLIEGRAKGFNVMVQGRKRACILILLESEVYAYENSCPHTGVSLDWMPDEFMDVSGKLLQCTTHGALFEPDNGLCIAGPCHGDSLTKLPVTLCDSAIYLDN